MMKLGILGIGAMLCLQGVAVAQDHGASGALDVQGGFANLAKQIADQKDQINLTNARLDQQLACNKRAMLFAGSAPGVDTKGCVSPAVPSALRDSVKSMNTNLTATSANVSKIIACNQQGRVFNGTACVATVPNCSLVMGPYWMTGRQGQAPTCPVGYMQVVTGAPSPNTNGGRGSSEYSYPVACLKVACQ